MFIKLFFLLSAMYKIKAINNEIITIERLERRIVSKKSRIKILMNPPTKRIGMVLTKIEYFNFLFKRKLSLIFEILFLDPKIFFLKYQIIAKTLPI